jgi:hypothetical protein
MDLNRKIENIYQDLVRSVSEIPNSYWSLDATVEWCASIYMDVLFSIRPIVSEAQIRASICLKPPRLGANFGVFSCSSRSRISSATPEDSEDIRSYTPVTALCAATAYLLSTENYPKGAGVGPVFLHASVRCGTFTRFGSRMPKFHIPHHSHVPSECSIYRLQTTPLVASLQCRTPAR